MEKRRAGNNDTVELLNVIGDVRGKVAVTYDDEIDTGGTLVQAASALVDAGAREVYSCATHGVFSNNALDRLNEAEAIREVVVTDTIAIPEAARASKLTVLSMAPLLGEAISRIESGRSVGALFN